MKYESIKINNFKAIQGNEALELDGLGKINYLIGPNNSGKSSVLEALFVLAGDVQLRGGLPEQSQHPIAFLHTRSVESLFTEKTKFDLKLDGKKGVCTVRLDSIKEEGKQFDLRLIYESSKEADSDLRNSIRNITKTFLVSDKYYRYFSKIGFFRSMSWEDQDKMSKYFPKNEALESRGYLLSLKDLFYDEKFDGEKVNQWKEFIANNYEEISCIMPYLFSEDKISIGKNFHTETSRINGSISFNDLSDGTLRLISLFCLAEHVRVHNPREQSPLQKKRIIICFDEIENNLHPHIQRRIPQILKSIYKKIAESGDFVQFFISTHSPFIVDAALELDQKIYQLKRAGQSIVCIPDKDGISSQTVNKIGRIPQYYSIYSDLGVKPSDFLFANCVIWVEGPSDALYIDFWLNKFAETQKGTLSTSDYTFGLLGGATAVNYGIEEKDSKLILEDSDDIEKAFNLLTIHPKSFVVLDNDGGTLWEEKPIRGKSNFEKFKEKIIEKFSDYWYERNPRLHTIECYINAFDFSSKESKVKKAEKHICDSRNKKIESIISEDGIKMIEKIYKFIVK